MIAPCRSSGKSSLLQRLPRKVVKRKRQHSEGEDADVVVIDERVREVEQVAVIEVGGFYSFEGYADQAYDAAGGYKPGCEQGAGGDFAFRFGCVAAGFFLPKSP